MAKCENCNSNTLTKDELKEIYHLLVRLGELSMDEKTIQKADMYGDKLFNMVLNTKLRG